MKTITLQVLPPTSFAKPCERINIEKLEKTIKANDVGRSYISYDDKTYTLYAHDLSSVSSKEVGEFEKTISNKLILLSEQLGLRETAAILPINFETVEAYKEHLLNSSELTPLLDSRHIVKVVYKPTIYLEQTQSNKPSEFIISGFNCLSCNETLHLLKVAREATKHTLAPYSLDSTIPNPPPIPPTPPTPPLKENNAKDKKDIAHEKLKDSAIQENPASPPQNNGLHKSTTRDIFGNTIFALSGFDLQNITFSTLYKNGLDKPTTNDTFSDITRDIFNDTCGETPNDTYGNTAPVTSYTLCTPAFQASSHNVITYDIARLNFHQLPSRLSGFDLQNINSIQLKLPKSTEVRISNNPAILFEQLNLKTLNEAVSRLAISIASITIDSTSETIKIQLQKRSNKHDSLPAITYTKVSDVQQH